MEGLDRYLEQTPEEYYGEANCIEMQRERNYIIRVNGFFKGTVKIHDRDIEEAKEYAASKGARLSEILNS